MPTDNTSPILPPARLHQVGIYCTTYTYGMRTDVHVSASCLIFPHSHTAIMPRMLSVGIVVLPSHGFIMQREIPRTIPILSPLVFMPSLYSLFHNSKINLLPFLCLRKHDIVHIPCSLLVANKSNQSDVVYQCTARNA